MLSSLTFKIKREVENKSQTKGHQTSSLMTDTAAEERDLGQVRCAVLAELTGATVCEPPTSGNTGPRCPARGGDGAQGPAALGGGEQAGAHAQSLLPTPHPRSRSSFRLLHGPPALFLPGSGSTFPPLRGSTRSEELRLPATNTHVRLGQSVRWVPIFSAQVFREKRRPQTAPIYKDSGGGGRVCKPGELSCHKELRNPSSSP